MTNHCFELHFERKNKKNLLFEQKNNDNFKVTDRPVTIRNGKFSNSNYQKEKSQYK